jgi:hypothetical protein
MDEVLQSLSDIQEQLEDIKCFLELEEPKKSICEIWKDNFLNFIKKNVKLL